MSSPPNSQPSSTNHPLDHIPRPNASSIFAFTLPLHPGAQSSQHARETTGRSDWRSTSARSRSVAPQTTHSSFSAPPSPVTPPDYLALEDLGTFVRDSVGAAGGVVDNASYFASTAPPFTSPPSTNPNIVSHLAPSSRSRAAHTGGGSCPPLSGCSSDRASVVPEVKDIQEVDVEKDLASVSVLPPSNCLLQDEHIGNMRVGEEDSPYVEVRVCVSNTDDPEMPALTFRVWVIGLPFCLIAACVNAYGTLRPAGSGVNNTAVILITYPVGKALAWALPIRSWIVPSTLPGIGGKEFSLNPCPFNIKEHALISVMINSSFFYPFAMQVVLVIRKKYGISIGFPSALCFELASRLLGLSMVAIGQRLVVERPSAIWPTVLVYPTLLNTLHAGVDVPRYRFFLIGSTIAFAYNFLPSFLFTALSHFSFICWIWPGNKIINQLFGSLTGLGMSILSFDWNQITSISEPLFTPWWSQANVAMGFVLACWVISPAIYYNNVWKSGHLPVSSASAFDRFAQPYDLNRVLNPDLTFNATAYTEYSPLYLTATFSVLYLGAFAVIPALFVYFTLQHGPTLLEVLNKRTKDEDIHARLMRQYNTVPVWWYVVTFILCFAMSIVSIKVQDVQTPVWMLLLALLLAVVSYPSTVCILAWSGQPISLNLMAEIIPGALLPGRPIANMISKAYSVETVAMALVYTGAFKLGHYLKLPPRTVFLVIVVTVATCCCAQVTLYWWLLSTVPDLCSPDQPNHLTCPAGQVIYTASILWGTIGPRRQLGQDGVYHLELYALVVGAVLPIPFWILQRRRSTSWARFVNVPIILYGSAYLPSWGSLPYTSSILVGFIFQCVIKRRNFRWWAKYNYILGAAFDAGTSLSAVVVAAALVIPKDGTLSPDWWGNSVWMNTADAIGVPSLPTDPIKGF